jgi:hypothetical protein
VHLAIDALFAMDAAKVERVETRFVPLASSDCEYRTRQQEEEDEDEDDDEDEDEDDDDEAPQPREQLIAYRISSAKRPRRPRG